MAKINLGNFIIEKRKKINLSSRQLALACDVTPPYMSDIEKNKRIPSFDLLTKLTKELKLEEQEIYQLFDLAVDDNNQVVIEDNRLVNFIRKEDE